MLRLLSRNGYDWTGRYPWIVEAALKNRQKHFVIDGEAVVLGVDGVPDFNALHSRRQDAEVQLYAFDMLAGAGDDLRSLPLVRPASHFTLIERCLQSRRRCQGRNRRCGFPMAGRPVRCALRFLVQIPRRGNGYR